MDYTTIYEISSKQPELWNQLWQDMFHPGNGLLDPGSCANARALVLLGLSFMLPALLIGIANVARTVIFDKVPFSNRAFWRIMLVAWPLTAAIILGSALSYFYPLHMDLAKNYESARCTVTEGRIRILERHKPAAGACAYVVFQLDGAPQGQLQSWDEKTFVISDHRAGFDNPNLPAIRNGNTIRIWRSSKLNDGFRPVVRVDIAKGS